MYIFKLQILLSHFGFLSTIVRTQLFLSLLDLFMNATVCNLLKSSNIVASSRRFCSKSFPSINYTIRISLVLRTIEKKNNIKSSCNCEIINKFFHQTNYFIHPFNSILNHLVCLQTVYYRNIKEHKKTFIMGCMCACPLF